MKCNCLVKETGEINSPSSLLTDVYATKDIQILFFQQQVPSKIIDVAS